MLAAGFERPARPGAPVAVQRLALLVIGSMVLLAATAVTWYIASEVGSLPGQEPRYWEPHLKAEHIAAPTNAANVKKALANTEPSTHGTSATSQDRRLNPLSVRDCVAKLFAVLRTRNYRIQPNGVFESMLRACARPRINIAHSGRKNSFATHSVQRAVIRRTSRQ